MFVVMAEVRPLGVQAGDDQATAISSSKCKDTFAQATSLQTQLALESARDGSLVGVVSNSQNASTAVECRLDGSAVSCGLCQDAVWCPHVAAFMRDMSVTPDMAVNLDGIRDALNRLSVREVALLVVKGMCASQEFAKCFMHQHALVRSHRTEHPGEPYPHGYVPQKSSHVNLGDWDMDTLHREHRRCVSIAKCHQRTPPGWRRWETFSIGASVWAKGTHAHKKWPLRALQTQVDMTHTVVLAFSQAATHSNPPLEFAWCSTCKTQWLVCPHALAVITRRAMGRELWAEALDNPLDADPPFHHAFGASRDHTLGLEGDVDLALKKVHSNVEQLQGWGVLRQVVLMCFFQTLLHKELLYSELKGFREMATPPQPPPAKRPRQCASDKEGPAVKKRRVKGGAAAAGAEDQGEGAKAEDTLPPMPELSQPWFHPYELFAIKDPDDVGGRHPGGGFQRRWEFVCLGQNFGEFVAYGRIPLGAPPTPGDRACLAEHFQSVMQEYLKNVEDEWKQKGEAEAPPADPLDKKAGKRKRPKPKPTPQDPPPKAADQPQIEPLVKFVEDTMNLMAEREACLTAVGLGTACCVAINEMAYAAVPHMTKQANDEHREMFEKHKIRLYKCAFHALVKATEDDLHAFSTWACDLGRGFTLLQAVSASMATQALVRRKQQRHLSLTAGWCGLRHATAFPREAQWEICLLADQLCRISLPSPVLLQTSEAAVVPQLKQLAEVVLARRLSAQMMSTPSETWAAFELFEAEAKAEQKLIRQMLLTLFSRVLLPAVDVHLDKPDPKAVKPKALVDIPQHGWKKPPMEAAAVVLQQGRALEDGTDLLTLLIRFLVVSPQASGATGPGGLNGVITLLKAAVSTQHARYFSGPFDAVGTIWARELGDGFTNQAVPEARRLAHFAKVWTLMTMAGKDVVLKRALLCNSKVRSTLEAHLVPWPHIYGPLGCYPANSLPPQHLTKFLEMVPLAKAYLERVRGDIATLLKKNLEVKVKNRSTYTRLLEMLSHMANHYMAFQDKECFTLLVEKLAAFHSRKDSLSRALLSFRDLKLRNWMDNDGVSWVERLRDDAYLLCSKKENDLINAELLHIVRSVNMADDDAMLAAKADPKPMEQRQPAQQNGHNVHI